MGVRQSQAMNGKPPVVLVTGTSSGIGREAVHHLRDAGCLVIATARRPESIADLAVAGKVETLELDVTSDANRRAVVDDVLRRHGRIDALVNNAGYGAMLAVEDTSDEAIKRMFETNLFAVHALTRLVLPGMRAQGSGRIVNVASIAGHVAVPTLGAYCSTKFALRALSQAMHVEVKPFGIHVALIEPGVITTNFGTHSLAQTKAAGADLEGPYARLYARYARTRATRVGKQPSIIATRIVRAVTSKRPKFHYFAPTKDAKLGNLAKRLIPDGILNWGMARYFR